MNIKEILQHDEKFRYQLLDRMRMDCEYYLGYGNRNTKKLWALDVNKHIKYMKAIHNSFAEDKKPEWLTMELINIYEAEMKLTDKYLLTGVIFFKNKAGLTFLAGSAIKGPKGGIYLLDEFCTEIALKKIKERDKNKSNYCDESELLHYGLCSGKYTCLYTNLDGQNNFIVPPEYGDRKVLRREKGLKFLQESGIIDKIIL